MLKYSPMTPIIASDRALIRRSCAAYLRSTPDGGVPSPENCQVMRRIDKKIYVIVRSRRRLLTVFRVRPVDGILRQLHRWPKEIQ